MSIIVEGIKMPKSCYSENGYCPFHFFAYEGDSHCSISECKCLKTARPKDCPLVEVPSDVRLIDAYSLAVKVAEAQDKLKGKEYDPFMLLGDVLRWIGLEPTVLEASTSPSGFCNTEGCSNSKSDMSKAQNHICPYYKGVCSLDENILCYCEHHYEMCEKFIKVGKEEKK